ncbi:PadR family transcriptional regulator [Actinosynnema sp. NPDC020468]|uniref:PadR family transcriptional regulator n=1 Tax=Actinosynnema sp. NPDC020468 TaxID=3154488 RepID=UPI0033EA435A
MALEHAILVSLDERDGSGYELARRFERSIGFFWAATHQQIYRTLKRMVGEGWVVGVDVAQDSRPDKRVYSVTNTGRVELRRWLAQPGEPSFLRDELAVKIRGAERADLPALLAEVERHRAAHAERLVVYLAIEERDFAGEVRGRARHQHLVLRGGIRAEQALVEWCDEVLTALREDPK